MTEKVSWSGTMPNHSPMRQQKIQSLSLRERVRVRGKLCLAISNFQFSIFNSPCAPVVPPWHHAAAASSPPSTLNPQPSTLNPQPSTLHPQLFFIESRRHRKPLVVL